MPGKYTRRNLLKKAGAAAIGLAFAARKGRASEKARRVPRQAAATKPVKTLPISDALVDFLQEKGFLDKTKKFDFSGKTVKIADYYEVRSAWYKHAYSMLKDTQFFRHASSKEKTKMLVAAGKGTDGLKEIFTHQKVLDSGELARYTRSLIEYAEWAK